MSTFYPKKEDTLTARNIIDSYLFAYEAIYGEKPTCEHLAGRWFMVEGVKRDRHWLVLEIERLRQEGISKALQDAGDDSRSGILRLIRRLSRL